MFIFFEIIFLFYSFSKPFALLLLFLHISCLCVFSVKKWSFLITHRYGSGSTHTHSSIHTPTHQPSHTLTHTPTHTPLTPQAIVACLFCCNFIGITFARSLHYQFYVWYFHQLPFLLFTARDALPLYIGVPILIAVEVIWNIFPSNAISSISLQIAHWAVLFALFRSKNTQISLSHTKKE